MSATGVWKKDSVRDVAESLGIATLPDEVAAALAGDVEYRLWELIEESLKFARHAKRTRLTTEDVSHALAAKNQEPLWGFAGSSQLPFKKTQTPSGNVYAIEDEEIDLSKMIKTEVPPVPREVSFTAHWLAIEGVQPLIKENPSQTELAKFSSNSRLPQAGSTPNGATANSAVTPLVKHVLSRELQLYFARVTEAISADQPELREAALGSVRSDPGLHQLVPYLVAWGAEQIATHLADLATLLRSLDLFHAMLENPTLFIEPYLHQITPPILTCLLTSSLAPAPPPSPSPLTIRTSAGSLLALLIARHAPAYPTLAPRVTKTLLRGLIGDGRGLGGRWGAARGLAAVMGSPSTSGKGAPEGGNSGVKLWVGQALRSLGEMIEGEQEEFEGEKSEVVTEVLDALQLSLLDPLVAEAVSVPSQAELDGRYGPLFGRAILQRWDQGGSRIWEQVNPDGEQPATDAMVL